MVWNPHLKFYNDNHGGRMILTEGDTPTDDIRVE
jgi:hypothetical protein